MSWILENKEWVFSGVGIFILGLLLRVFVKPKSEARFSIKSGKNSTNIQIDNSEK